MTLAKLNIKLLEETTNDLSRRVGGLLSFSVQGLVHWIDILLVAYLFFRIFKLIRGRQAWRIFLGALTFVLALFLSEQLHLGTLHYVLDKAAPLAPVALVILYLPELRQALEGFSRLGLWSERLLIGEEAVRPTAVDEIVQAAGVMAEHRIGALIVIEASARLDDIIDTGTMINAQVSAPLLQSIFYGENPLHDGAAVIRGRTLVAAACRLPLSESTQLSKHVHMRHRAGVGISESTDCVVVIISEERGRISMAVDGRLTEVGSLEELTDRLDQTFGGNKPVRKTRQSRKKKAV